MVGRMANVLWLEGSFVETIKGWQSGWFYITEPRDSNWAAAPEFRSGIPMRLTSWKRKGLAWGAPSELTRLQNCIKNMNQEDQACQCGPGHAISPDSPVSKMGIQPMGVRHGPTPDTARALRHDAQRRLEGVVQGQQSSSSHQRGPRTQRQAPCQCGKYSAFRKMCPSLVCLWEESKPSY